MQQAWSRVTAASSEELEQQIILKSQQERGSSLEDTVTPETLIQSPGPGGGMFYTTVRAAPSYRGFSSPGSIQGNCANRYHRSNRFLIEVSRPGRRRAVRTRDRGSLRNPNTALTPSNDDITRSISRRPLRLAAAAGTLAEDRAHVFVLPSIFSC